MPDDRNKAPGAAAAAVDKGRAHHDAGRLAEAEADYREALAAAPDNPDALFRLGGIALQQGKNARAADLIARAIAGDPGVADYHINLGIALSAQGKAKDAVAAFQQGVALAPDNAEAHYNLAICLQRIGETGDAVAAFRRAVELRPDMAAAHYNLATALKAEGRPEDAVAAFHQALALNPGHAEAHNNFGNVLRDQGKLEAAAEAYDSAIALKPDFAEAHNNRGAVLQDQGRPGDAVAALERALALKPGYAEAHFNLANARRAQGKLDNAVAAYLTAVQVRPDYASAHNNLGAVLQDQGKLAAAEAAFRKAVAARPKYADAHNNLGSALKDQGRLDEAVQSYRRAVDIDPAFDAAHSNLLYCLNYMPGLDPKAVFDAHVKWGEQHAPESLSHDRAFPNTPEAARRLRIGYVSPDFRAHPLASFFESLLAAADPAQVLNICYADVRNPDDTTAKLRHRAGAWRDIFGHTDQAVAERIRRDGIDILVDLTGHTADNRLKLFAAKPAPVQITYMGYCNTTGVRAIDYILSDHLIDPAGGDEFYSEALLRLPRSICCYTPPDYAPVVKVGAAAPGATVTFGCFNNLTKLNAEVVALWSKILGAVGDPRLVLKCKQQEDDAMRRRVCDMFRTQGIAPQRLDLRGHSAHPDLLAQYNDIDIALDPFPFAGMTTTCEALWMGVPVITLAGSNRVGRVGVSLLSAVGLQEFIAETPDAYMEIAARLAADRPRMAELKSSIRPRMAASELCDTEAMARAVEDAYRTVWRAWCAAG